MIVVRTPLRISFAGGGTDFPEYFRKEGGFVVSSSIDKYVTVIVSERFDAKLYINYTKKEIVEDVDDVQHELVREALYYSEIRSGVEITMLADIPAEGSGLGSSSSLTVALLHALYAYRGMPCDAGKLARDACGIELYDLGRPMGYQDQYIAAFGGTRGFEFTAAGGQAFQPLLTPDERRRLSQELMLFFTGVTRQNGPILADQKANVELNRGALSQMKAEAIELHRRLLRHEPAGIGAALSSGWQMKQALAAGISTPLLDALWRTAMEQGAAGAKIAGAGGGGFLLAHVPLERQATLREVLERFPGVRELPFSLTRYGSQIVYSNLE